MGRQRDRQRAAGQFLGAHLCDCIQSAAHAAFTPNLLLDANAGYTRQHPKATNIDIGSPYGLNTLKIPGTNDAGLGTTNQLYWGQPAFTFSTFSPLGNTAASNPFEFRDNQILGNVNLTWVKGRHQFRAGFEDDHTGINHFQPQGNATPRGSFSFTGGSTELPTDLPTTTEYQSYADFLLGLPTTTGKTIQALKIPTRVALEPIGRLRPRPVGR